MSEAERKTENSTTGTTPSVDSGPAQNDSSRTRLAIPLLLLAALVVAVLATFFDGAFDRMMAMFRPVEQQPVAEIPISVQPAPDKIRAADIEPPAQDPATDTASAESPADNSSMHPAAAGETSGFPGAPAARDSVTDPGAAEPAAPVTSARTSPEIATAFTPDSNRTGFNPHYASPDYGTPFQTHAYQDSKEHMQMVEQQRKIWQAIEDQRRKDWEEMMENRREAWLEAENARREREQSRYEYRTRLLERIEKDREDMDRYAQQMREDIQRRREQTDRNMFDRRRRTARNPI